MSSVADVLVVGAGIAGCEAAWRCAEAGLDVVLVTTSLDTVYSLASDAPRLAPPRDSLMALVVPVAAGGAVPTHSWDLHRGAKYALESRPTIHLLQSTVSALLFDEQGAVTGVRTWEGIDRRARLTALCVGSFLRARLSSGTVTEAQGRLSEMAYDDLYEDLVDRGFQFLPVSFTGAPHAGSLPYVVDTVALAADERMGDATGSARAELWRAPGLFAAGVCIAPARLAARVELAAASTPAEPAARATDLTYAEVARLGMALGDELIARSVQTGDSDL